MRLSCVLLFAALAYGQTVSQKPDPKPVTYPVNTAKYWKLVSATKDAQIALMITPQAKALDAANKAVQDEISAQQALCATHGKDFVIENDPDKDSPTFGEPICLEKKLVTGTQK